MEKIFKTTHGEYLLDTVRDEKMCSILEQVGAYNNETTLDLLPFLMERGGVAVDIGAHVGTLAIPFSRYAGTVIAFEPNKETFAFLQKNVNLNAANVDARNKGLGVAHDRASSVVVHESSAAANTLMVGTGDIEISTLDEEVLAANFVKIDVEGMELSVFRGGSRLWRESKPVILFEVNLFALRRNATSVHQLQQFLQGYGYQLYIPLMNEGRLTLGRVGSLRALAACIAPRAFVLRGPSAPFDVVAISENKIGKIMLPKLSAVHTLGIFAGQNIANKWHRFLRAIYGKR